LFGRNTNKANHQARLQQTVSYILQGLYILDAGNEKLLNRTNEDTCLVSRGIFDSTKAWEPTSFCKPARGIPGKSILSAIPVQFLNCISMVLLNRSKPLKKVLHE
jgi:hypothetical protein